VMPHSILIRKNMVLAFVLGCLLVPAARALAVDSDIKLQINSDGNFFDVYIANSSEDIVSIYPRISYLGVERNISLFFFKGKERCSECALKSDASMPLSVPPGKGTISLAPSELIGRRFEESAIASSYSLKPGCYGVYATYREKYPPTGAFAGVIVSNAVRMCVP